MSTTDIWLDSKYASGSYLFLSNLQFLWKVKLMSYHLETSVKTNQTYLHFSVTFSKISWLLKTVLTLMPHLDATLNDVIKWVTGNYLVIVSFAKGPRLIHIIIAIIYTDCIASRAVSFLWCRLCFMC